MTKGVTNASAFAAQAAASAAVAGLTLSEVQLSRLARRGSGSPSRSVPAGFREPFGESFYQSISPALMILSSDIAWLARVEKVNLFEETLETPSFPLAR